MTTPAKPGTMRLRAGDRYQFHGLDGDTDPLAGQLEITLLSATHDGQIAYRVTFPGSTGSANRAIPISDATKMIELGIWEPTAAEPDSQEGPTR